MIGNLVWARAPKNNLWWPSKTISPEEMDVQDFMDKKKPDSVLIYFFGYHTVHWINDNYVKEYSMEYLDQDMPRIEYELFKLALKEIENQKLEKHNLLKQQQQHQSIKSYQQQQQNNHHQQILNSDDDDHQMTICEDDEEEMVGHRIHQHHQQQQHHDDDEVDIHQPSIHSEDDYDSQLLTRMKRGRNEESIVYKQQQQQLHQQQQSPSQNKSSIKSQPIINQPKKHLHDDENMEYNNTTEMELELSKDGAQEYSPSQLKKKKTSHPNSRVVQDDVGSDDRQHSDSSDPQQDEKNKEHGSSSPIVSSRRKSESPTESMASQQQDASSSPQLNSKRLLLTKPPRSPLINSRGTKPVVVSNNQSNNTTSSITTISKPIASPPTRSATSQVTSPFSLSMQPRAILPNSPPILPSKLPQAIVSSLMQKKGIQASPNLVSQGQASPSIHPKTPITLSIPRFKKNAAVPSSNNITSPSIQSTSMTSSASAPSPLHGPASPFQLPQRKGLMYPQSPSMNQPMRGTTPLIRPPSMQPNSDKSDENTDHLPPNTQGTPILAPGFQYLPYFSMPPFSLNSSLNMETVFTSPFNGRLAIKGSVDTGFQIDLNVMGKNLQGFLTEIPGTTISQQAPPPTTPLVKPAAVATPNIPMPAGYDYQMMESFRQMQEMMFKSYQAAGTIPPFFNPAAMAAAMGMPFNHAKPTTSTTTTTTTIPHTSTTSTPTQAPKTPNIVINIAKDDQPASIESTTTPVITSASLSSHMTSNSSNAANVSTSSNTLSASNTSNDSHFIQYKQNALQKVELFHKSQALSMMSKQDEASSSLLEQYERDKLSADGNPEKLIALKAKFSEDSEKMQQQHKEQRIKLEETHSQQSARFPREVEKQYMLLLKQRQIDSSKSDRSPLNSPTLTPFISPSPSPSPSLSSFMGTSPMITPASLMKGNSLYPPGSISGAHSLTPTPTTTSHSIHTTNQTGNGNSKDSNESSLPPLSLSSNSPPRSPNEQALSLQKKNTILNNNSSNNSNNNSNIKSNNNNNNNNNTSNSNNKTIETSEIEEETALSKISVNSNNTTKKSHNAPALTIS
ncbi:hypothetical protein PPL_01035 [Heterostelium album PN500]|uniref:PWWP domain-containing protein n=1 Tax=Heterostelium pallidum (strain ATCC 26659 / Pp 5 / PN500) TaxID=670386 RepID=D3AXX7_HETP5|nr:hypothetical protein PPL_01035 [Heterostelium album PN500]EFA85804.1 hypothetical protein PPL_01035 [Heterostelium album PN500]|eukprot:XP_020437910.1 hypothetical protein PPL_01035 [Heterostelium album PN500]